jgi:hypothetical protein
MKAYQTKIAKLPGTDFHEVNKKARAVYVQYTSRTKRKPYIRSAYFNKEKIFLDYFWQHLWDKNWRDRVRRVKYFACGLELIKNSKQEPLTKQNPNNTNELLHRFAGLTKDKEIFFVQIKENKRSDKKYLVSIFPEEG